MRTFALVIAAVLVVGVSAAVTERSLARATTAAHDAAKQLEVATLSFQSAWAGTGPGPLTTRATALTTAGNAIVKGIGAAMTGRYMPEGIAAMTDVMKFVTSAADVSTTSTGVHASEQMDTTWLLMNARNLQTILPATAPPAGAAPAAAAAGVPQKAVGAVAAPPTRFLPPRFVEEQESEEDEAEAEAEAEDEMASEDEVDAEEAAETEDELADEDESEADAEDDMDTEEDAFIEVAGPWSSVRDQAIAAQAAAVAIAPLVTARLADVSGAAKVLVDKAAAALQATETLQKLWAAYSVGRPPQDTMGGVSAAAAVMTAQQALVTAQQLVGHVVNAQAGWPAVLPKCVANVAAAEVMVKSISKIASSNP